MALGIGIGLSLVLLGKAVFDDGSSYVVTDYVDVDYFTP